MSGIILAWSIFGHEKADPSTAGISFGPGSVDEIPLLRNKEPRKTRKQGTGRGEDEPEKMKEDDSGSWIPER